MTKFDILEGIVEDSKVNDFQQDEPTKDHDILMIWFAEHWKAIVVKIVNSENFKAEMRLEPVLDGHPPLFPDAIVLADEWAIVFELKPKILSCGSLIRQLNHYGSRFGGHRYVRSTYTIGAGSGYNVSRWVVTPDKRFDNILRDQGIGVVHPEDFP